MLSYVKTVDTLRSKHTEECIVCYVSCRDCQYKRSKHIMLQWCKSYPMSRQSIQNAYRCTHVSAHNFLNIQRIFNPKKVLECWESGLSNRTIKSYMSIVSTVSTLPVHYCIEILRLVSTVSTYIGFGGTVGKAWFPAFQNFFRIENPLNIKEVMGRNMWTCICISYRLSRHRIAFAPLKHDMLWSLVSTVSTWNTTHNALLSMLWS